MGVLHRFERRLERLVEGAFAKTFGGAVEPVEIAARLQREAADRVAVVSAGRSLVPNDFDVELGPSDHDRLGEYDEALCAELADILAEHAQEQGWAFVGPVAVHLVRSEDLSTGAFRVRSRAVPGEQPAPTQEPGAPAAEPPPAPPAVLHVDGLEIELAPVTLLGRAAECQVVLDDSGVSRRHAEIRLVGPDRVLVDLGSTNGTRVNGAVVQQIVLRDGDRLTLGSTTLTVHLPGHA